MLTPSSFKSIIELWPTREAMAAALREDSGLVSKWWQRDKIPAERWAQLLALAPVVEAGVTAEFLTRLIARPARSGRSKTDRRSKRRPPRWPEMKARRFLPEGYGEAAR